MKRLSVFILVLGLLLSGCSTLWDGSYHSAKPHEIQVSPGQSGDMSAANYQQLCAALAKMVSEGMTGGIITVARYDQTSLISEMNRAVREVSTLDPIAAYAVSSIRCELGTSGGQSAIAVSISYTHDRSEILRIHRAENLQRAQEVIAEALDACSSGVVLYLTQYEEVDFAQIVEDYADSSPQTVMETPAVTANVYPNEGQTRVVELKFTYKSSRDALRQMQTKVAQLFTSAELYVNSEAPVQEQYSLLNSFLMGLGAYTVETSITPAYSLLCHNVGDSKAFAVTYAAMCRQVDLPCYVVTGTRRGEAWYWNLVFDGENYYHVDLLRSSTEGEFRIYPESDMAGYVWDYSAFEPEALQNP